MSSSVTVVGGVNGSSISGTVSVPVVGLSTTAGSALQATLTALSNLVAAGTEGLTNDNLLAGASSGTTISGTNNLLVLSNTDSVGGTTSGAASTVASVSSIYGSVVVQAPGTLTVNGAGTGTTTYVLGAQSNVDLFTTGGTSSVVAAGGNDTLNLSGTNSVTVSGGVDKIKPLLGSDTVVATGSASVTAGSPPGYAGTLDFINNSSATAFLGGGAGSATVFGGDAGGTFFGGSSGSNSLVGGNGSAFLVGGGNNDTLVAGGNGATTSTAANYLFAGFGNETLLASSVTGTNLFQAGSGTDMISSSGSGTQYFFGSTGSATITGSTVSGASNQYFFGSATNGGGNDVINNFGKSSELIVTDGRNITTIVSTQFGTTPSSLVVLNDGTAITLKGVAASSIVGSVGKSFIA